MSKNDATAACGLRAPGRNSGCELMEIQVKSPLGLWTPMMTLAHGLPVRRVVTIGWVSPGNGERSSWMARHRGSNEVRPAICSAVSPRIRSALTLEACSRPLASMKTMPSASAETTEPYRFSLAWSASSAPLLALRVRVAERGLRRSFPWSLTPRPPLPRQSDDVEPTLMSDALAPQPRAFLRQRGAVSRHLDTPVRRCPSVRSLSDGPSQRTRVG